MWWTLLHNGQSSEISMSYSSTPCLAFLEISRENNVLHKIYITAKSIYVKRYCYVNWKKKCTVTENYHVMQFYLQLYIISKILLHTNLQSLQLLHLQLLSRSDNLYCFHYICTLQCGKVVLRLFWESFHDRKSTAFFQTVHILTDCRRRWQQNHSVSKLSCHGMVLHMIRQRYLLQTTD